MKCNIICNFAVEKKEQQMQDINLQNIQMLSSLLSEAGKTAVITHMKPDGDAMGSSLAMFHYLDSYGKDCSIVLPDRYPSNLSFLISPRSASKIVICETQRKEAARVIEEADLLICLDFNAFHRTDRLEEFLQESKAKKILIDHHLNPDRSVFDLSFSETQVSSASELLFHILMETESIGRDASRLPVMSLNALMTGMTTDTNNFANSVYPSTLRMASELLAAGCDRDTILANLYNRFSELRLRLMGHMMKDLLTITEDGVAYIILDGRTQYEYKVEDGDTEGFVNMPLSIDRVRMSILLKEDKDRIRVSIRSKKGISANRCAMRYFNGGGHENAAGGRLSIPADISGIEAAGQYIEEATHKFMTVDK